MRSRFGGLRPLGLLALWLAATLGLRPLLLPDEGRYAGVAREMLQGDGLVPLLNGLPFFHKPPLLYWLDMAAMSLLGAGEWATLWAARFVPARLAWVLGAALFVHLRRWHGAAVARAGLLVLATAPLFFVGAQYVNHDMGVAGCITLAVLLLVRAVDDPAHTSLRWLMLPSASDSAAMRSSASRELTIEARDLRRSQSWNELGRDGAQGARPGVGVGPAARAAVADRASPRPG